MQDDLKQMFENILKLVNDDLYTEAVAQVQYWVQAIPQAKRDEVMESLTHSQLMQVSKALPLAWREANALSKAEGQRLIEAALVIVMKLLALGFSQEWSAPSMSGNRLYGF